MRASVVISPAITTRPVVTRVSQATLPVLSSERTESRTASEIWSAILSGWPSVTDSEVKICRSFSDICFLIGILIERAQRDREVSREGKPGRRDYALTMQLYPGGRCMGTGRGSASYQYACRG